ncbi:hypothetical protein [Sodalis glossinidius]|uniref:hypothetical protein n=1 Tax=Sodalis glossinidius TaxID=63612 RepID=UPI0002E2081D|nr:hypothetical protein [Sodalis glossinidius]
MIQLKALSAGHLADVKIVPVNLFINGNMVYYLLYAIFGRAIGLLTLDNKRVTPLAAVVFLLAVVLIAAVSLFIWFKSALVSMAL